MPSMRTTALILLPYARRADVCMQHAPRRDAVDERKEPLTFMPAYV